MHFLLTRQAETLRPQRFHYWSRNRMKLWVHRLLVIVL